MLSKIATFTQDESGATAIEYGLIATLIAVGIIAAMMAFGGGLAGLFNSVSSKSQNAMGS